VTDVRIYALLARSAPRAVIFRRGPSKKVLLLGWNTATDEIEEGQWFRGRIYERRCDLSPDGKLLLYFAATSGGKDRKHGSQAKTWIELDPPVLWEKPHPIDSRYILQMSIHGIRERGGPWYLIEHRVLCDGIESHPVGRSDWAEWSESGDLLFARQSSLYRLGYADRELPPLASARPIIDLTAPTASGTPRTPRSSTR
jgi:hypothetical protein